MKRALDATVYGMYIQNMDNATKMLNDAENDIDKIYAALDAPDLTDEEETFHLAELRLAVQRRDMARAALRIERHLQKSETTP